MRDRRLSKAAWACAWVWLLLLAPGLRAQLQDERAVRAAFVLNLTKYVEWPHPSRQLVIGFKGDGPMGETLQTMLAGKSSDSRTIQVVLLRNDDPPDGCDLLYLAYSSDKQLRAALDRARTSSVLTVGETESFTRSGGMVGLVRSGERVKIEVNLDLVQQSQLKISSRLLSLATIVPASGGRN